MTSVLKPGIAECAPFMDYLEGWLQRLALLPLEDMIRDAGGPEHVGMFCVDVTNGFCHEGPLQSDRVEGIIGPVVRLLGRGAELGVTEFVLPQDSHPADSPEFDAYPPHCIAGTREAQTVPELMRLPFADRFQVVPKRSVDPSVRTDLPRWVDEHLGITHRIVVGDCTDICTYQLALYLKAEANARNVGSTVIVPADCVQTYDLPVDVARDLGILAHPGDFFHAVFLYHMALNGVKVVRSVP